MQEESSAIYLIEPIENQVLKKVGPEIHNSYNQNLDKNTEINQEKISQEEYESNIKTQWTVLEDQEDIE